VPIRPRWAGRWPDAAAKSVHHANDKEFLRPPVMPGEKTRRTDLRHQRRRRHEGVPAETWGLIDEVVEIPMVGRGASLNVAVAGSLVLYRLAGLM
jgi:tRNA (guanosine-2'-O-)-methyltransferase